MHFVRTYLFLLAFITTAALAASYESERYSINVPVGFEGPVSQSMGAELQMAAFAKPHANGQTSTLLQISTYNLGPKMPSIPPEHIGEAADKYVMQFLGGIERRRQDFRAREPERITLDGIAASRVTWTGQANGLGMHGIMFCVLIQGQVITLHVQDIDSAPVANLKEAEAAIRKIRFKR